MDLTELPNRHFVAAVTPTTGAIDANSRTLTVELDVPNPSVNCFLELTQTYIFSYR
ncbi:hypothetical protein SBA4_4300006 [Candidatus Sulfopaludibacter sp. SbA4]|nr:hypothetical protein SBA4_4300006 [Candidatus Sulfopaludibacter sp. SbA4]